MRHDVFISYASEDEEVALDILHFLEHRGISCWFDKQKLRFTREYDKEIEEAIRRSIVVLRGQNNRWSWSVSRSHLAMM